MASDLPVLLGFAVAFAKDYATVFCQNVGICLTNT
jgi:hypothetical protein